MCCQSFELTERKRNWKEGGIEKERKNIDTEKEEDKFKKLE